MTTRYRVEYALKTHRRDQLIEWIKGLLAVPFVLHSHQPSPVPPNLDDPSRPAPMKTRSGSINKIAPRARARYLEIMRDVENLINNHIAHQAVGTDDRSKLKLLVPGVGTFFTPLLLEKAFEYVDARRRISWRRFVAPSFNDIRLTLNTAQVLGLIRSPNAGLELITFDGDVTLYEDGANMAPDNLVIPRIVRLLAQGVKVGIVTAAGYDEAEKYYERLSGLLRAIEAGVQEGSLKQPVPLVVLGGEANYLFEYDLGEPKYLLRHIPREKWLLPAMREWKDEDIAELLDIAQETLKECVTDLGLQANLVRKERAVGIFQADPQNSKFTRESLEETVLVLQRVIESSPAAQRIPFCAFTGGADVFVDIGDKSWGVRCCRKYLGDVEGKRTLHVGDQFLSAGGGNDFKARLACTTAWVASPAETWGLLDEVELHKREWEEERQ